MLPHSQVSGAQRGRGPVLMLEGLYLLVSAVSVLAEKGENERIKFFMEPVLIIFVFSQFYKVWQSMRPGVEDHA